jgi:hypothetical protein
LILPQQTPAVDKPWDGAGKKHRDPGRCNSHARAGAVLPSCVHQGGASRQPDIQHRSTNAAQDGKDETPKETGPDGISHRGFIFLTLSSRRSTQRYTQRRQSYPQRDDQSGTKADAAKTVGQQRQEAAGSYKIRE